MLEEERLKLDKKAFEMISRQRDMMDIIAYSTGVAVTEALQPILVRQFAELLEEDIATVLLLVKEGLYTPETPEEQDTLDFAQKALTEPNDEAFKATIERFKFNSKVQYALKRTADSGEQMPPEIEAEGREIAEVYNLRGPARGAELVEERIAEEKKHYEQMRWAGLLPGRGSSQTN